MAGKTCDFSVIVRRRKRVAPARPFSMSFISTPVAMRKNMMNECAITSRNVVLSRRAGSAGAAGDLRRDHVAEQRSTPASDGGAHQGQGRGARCAIGSGPHRGLARQFNRAGARARPRPLGVKSGPAMPSATASASRSIAREPFARP